MKSFVRVAAIAATVLVWAMQVDAEWPPVTGPFFDDCYGKAQVSCKKECTWSVLRFPWCFNKEYLALSPSETIDVTDNIGLSLKFFAFSYGVHLSDGNYLQTYYNVLVDECARLCLVSAGNAGNKRCLSFDFYPFEDPLYSEPWLESHQSGICSLNGATSSTARLRNEDQGYTDAELYYASHFTHRPVSDLSGYYELRDSRGDSVGGLLDYNGGGENSIPTINLWGKSRWGLFHIKFPDIRTPQTGGTGSRFSGGYTPVDDSQRCPGLLTKSATEAMCQSSGGRLCTAAEIESLKGRKLGCSLDAYPVWSKDDPNVGTKFARCCADYEMPVDASYFSAQRQGFCNSQLILWDCTFKASGTTMQFDGGFGHLLDKFRDRCASGEFGSSCQGALVTPWYFRERCIWCPKLGGTENSGDCRVGSDFGICPYAPEDSKTLFGINLWNVFGKTATCGLKKVYPDLKLPATCD